MSRRRVPRRATALIASLLTLLAACGGSGASSSAPAPGPPALPGEPSSVDLLVLADRDVAAAWPREQLTRLVYERVRRANAAHRRSASPVRLRLVGVLEAPYPQGGGLVAAVGWVRSSNWVADQRDRLGADLVTLFTSDTDPIGAGRADQPGFASALHQTELTGPQPSFTHELAHSIGARHDQSHSLGSAVTIMSESPARIDYFSTPLVDHRGTPVGTASADNRSILAGGLATAVERRIARTGPGVTCVANLVAGQAELSANVNAAGHRIARVHFYGDGVHLGSDATAPYAFAVDLVGAGDFHFLAVAETKDGRFAAAETEATLTLAPDPARAYAPWHLRVLGYAADVDVRELATDSWRLVGDGTLLGGQHDRGAFLHQPISGDFVCTARLINATGSAGLMARADARADAPCEAIYAFAPFSAGGGRYRAGLAFDFVFGGGLEGQWIRLERRGDRIMTAISDNGVDFSVVSDNRTRLPDRVLVGAFSNAAGGGGTLPEPEFHDLIIRIPPQAGG